MQNQPQIEAKNLTLIEDQMNLEALAHKKCTVYSSYFTDPTLKTLASEMAQHHKQHFSELLQYLNTHQ